MDERETQQTKQAFLKAINVASNVLKQALDIHLGDARYVVHVVIAGEEDWLTGTSTSKETPSQMFRDIAMGRALHQARVPKARNGWVSVNYEVSYPGHIGSARYDTICVGVASDRPKKDDITSVMFAELVWELFTDELDERWLVEEIDDAVLETT